MLGEITETMSPSKANETLHGILAFILDRTSVKAQNPPDFSVILSEYPNAVAFTNSNLSFYFTHLSLKFGQEVVFNTILDFLFHDQAADFPQSSSLEDVRTRRRYIIYEYIVAQLGQGASRFCASNRPTNCFGSFFRQHDKDATKLPTNLGTTNNHELEILKTNSRFIEFGSISFTPQDLLRLEWKISAARDRSTKEMLTLCDMLMYRYYTALRTTIVCRILRVLSNPKHRQYAPSKYLMDSTKILFRNKCTSVRDKDSRIRKSMKPKFHISPRNELPRVVSPKDFSILYSTILNLCFSENIALTAAISEIMHAPFHLLQNLSLPGVEDVLLQFLGSSQATSAPLHERMFSYLHSSGWMDFVLSIFNPGVYEKRVQHLLAPHPASNRNFKGRRKRLKKRRCESACPVEHRQIVKSLTNKTDLGQRSSSWSPSRRLNSYLQVRTKYRRLRQSCAGSSSEGQQPFQERRHLSSASREGNFFENSLQGAKLLDASWSEDFSSLTNGEESNRTVASYLESMTDWSPPIVPIMEVVTPRSECSLENKDKGNRGPESENYDSPSEASTRSNFCQESKIRPSPNERSFILKRTKVNDVVNFLCRVLEGGNKVQPDQLEPFTFGEFVTRIKNPQDHCHSFNRVLNFDEKNFRDAVLNVSQGYMDTLNNNISAEEGFRNLRLFQCVRPHYEFLYLLFVESRMCFCLTESIQKGINFESSLLLLQTIVKSALPGQCLSYFADSISQQLAQCFVPLANQIATRLEAFLPSTFRDKTGLPNLGSFEGSSLLTTASSEGSGIGLRKATDRTSTRSAVASGRCTTSRSGIDIATLGLVSLLASATKIRTNHQVLKKEPLRFWKILTGAFLTQRNNIFLTKCGQIIEKGLQSEELSLRLSITTETSLVEGLCQRIKEDDGDGLPYIEFVARALEAAALYEMDQSLPNVESTCGASVKTEEESNRFIVRDFEKCTKDLEAPWVELGSPANETPTQKILTYLTKDKWEDWKHVCVFMDAKKMHQKPDLSAVMSLEDACKIRAARRAEQRIRREDELMDF